MLKTVSSITNAIGALNYKGTWNASTNTPTLASGVGIKGDYYQVSVAGATALDGISNWGVGDVVAFNGTTWQRIEGGADLNGVNLSYTGTMTGGTGVVNLGSGQLYKDASGNVMFGATSSPDNCHIFKKDLGQQNLIAKWDGSGGTSAYMRVVNNQGWNTISNNCFYVGTDSVSGRSINAGGTINASGTDYAEYMQKAGDFQIAKGDICGINAEGKLTNVFEDAVAFVIKSTNPSYVGGDGWCSTDLVGSEPSKPVRQEGESDVDYEIRLKPYKEQFYKWYARCEVERAKVDRIAFCGQAPVNVIGALPGQYVVPVNDAGAIKGIAVSNPTFEQYQTAIGKVIAIEQDGRARVIVKVS